MKTTSATFDAQVGAYERLRDGQDKFTAQRDFLLQNITGRVLEIAPGPGFNFTYYKKIDHLTAIDISPKMVQSAKEKWEEQNSIPANFIVGDVEDVDLEKEQFDFIVSTCSLCAYENPVHVLNIINMWCKPNGTVYLLEHGLSANWFVRLLQHFWEPIHYKQHGCHCNRNINEILDSSALLIEKKVQLRKYALIDFIYAIVAKPQK